MFHPLRRVAARFVATSFLNHAAAMPGLTGEHLAALQKFSDNEGGAFHHLVGDILDGSSSADPVVAGLHAALAAAPVPGKPHPVLDWLTHGGFQWIWAIASAIAQALFHFPIPPLPPLPPVPPAPTAEVVPSGGAAPPVLVG